MRVFLLVLRRAASNPASRFAALFRPLPNSESGREFLDQASENSHNFGFRRRGARAAKGGRL